MLCIPLLLGSWIGLALALVLVERTLAKQLPRPAPTTRRGYATVSFR
jgi:hypothetical protein